ncbi:MULTISPECIES: efflux RND transporter periplasmic adaptor subunit [Paraburkholderia]|uniref:Membrane fusion protein (Multidrug efflux system) n=1 Tax=Paraburkholderia tropica TaxID=92647 RepID=A0AAQ1GLK9_9BURK|nr:MULTISPECIES: efflux RND transporter periplasmic adaptor subunit [Paraburkholderia]MDE1143365.1 efflux RND transporter periplasmic adaptor subunit [Paraburkholderia tropica]PXX10629.1 membrane fusion protein (multidrug efflux system) [Paraburkholderia tropica]PZW75384.1 membrane fusion protein (multidrug efflux system) [Paraburkholderia tropica]QNB12178.1 efflux RND transporter periplasmic adaptor subunit [Paraburkholderia tropica]RQM49683.1 efflux RND transporter periplasmic adaptor subuni
MRVERVPFRLISFATAAIVLAACGQKQSAPPPQTPEVGIVTLQPTAVPVVSELPGRTNAFLVAQVRARVDGIVLRREFTEGSVVKAGQRLYKIDPAPYIATLNNAKATLAKAQANLVTQNALVTRYKVLVQANAVSKQDYDNAVSAQGQAAADVAAGKAAVDTAQINLGYTDVVSPITGKVGISQVTPGAYVQASAATLLSTVQQMDPMYVDLTQSSLDGLKLRREIQEGRLKTNGPDAAKVSLVLEDGRTYAQQGKLQFTDVTVDQTTGSVTIRALFSNPDHVLLPGMFVRARIDEGTNERAFLVPQIGVLHDQKGQATVLVVNKDNKVELRPIVTSGSQGQDWIVESGINAGDRVIVQGTEKVKPGAEVKPVDAHLPPPPPPGAPSADEATASGNASASAASGASAASAPAASAAQ